MTKSKTNLNDKEREELGVNVDSPNTIPENISPVIKANLLEEHRKKEGLVAAQDQPTAIEVGNQLARERAAADGDKDMQKLLATEQEDADKTAQAKAESAPKPDTQTVQTAQNKQQTSGARRQGDINKQ